MEYEAPTLIVEPVVEKEHVEPSDTQNPSHTPPPYYRPTRLRRKPDRYIDEDLKKAFDEDNKKHFYYADDSDSGKSWEYELSETESKSDNEYDYDSDTLRDFVVSDDSESQTNEKDTEKGAE